MGLFGKSKKELLEWQNMVLSPPSKKLVMSEAQLRKISLPIAQNSLRILKESGQLCESTKKPDVFFSRYKLMIQHAQYLVALSRFISFSGTTPKAVLDQAIEKRPLLIKQLIDRCFSDAELLKTDSAKAKRYTKILNDFSPYRVEIDNWNWNYLESICHQKKENGTKTSKSKK